MSQRGGSVVTYVRWGEKVYSPIIDRGMAACHSSSVKPNHLDSRPMRTMFTALLLPASPGGSVVTYVRWGEKVYSPIIDRGQADVILSFELLEAARWTEYLLLRLRLPSQTERLLIHLQEFGRHALFDGGLPLLLRPSTTPSVPAAAYVPSCANSTPWAERRIFQQGAGAAGDNDGGLLRRQLLLDRRVAGGHGL